MRINAIDALRGIAALAVVWRHFTYPHPELQPYGIYGSYGVQAFFIISGFVLPYSFKVADYKIGFFWQFLKKRIIRLDPAYIAAGIFALLLLWLNGREIISPLAMILHFGYLTDIFGNKWASGVFWTLAIEFQFYIFIGLTYNLIVRNFNTFVFYLIGVIVFTALFKKAEYLPFWLPFFTLGTLVFCIKYPLFQLGLTEKSILLLIGIILLILIKFTHGWVATVTSLLSLAFIILPNKSNFLINRGTLWLGLISYSLYLTHNEWGKIALWLMKHLIPGASPYLIVPVQLVFSFFFAYIFYRIFEKPFRKWSSAISYRPKEIT